MLANKLHLISSYVISKFLGDYVAFETNVSDKRFIEEQRFEAIMASLSSSNNKYR